MEFKLKSLIALLLSLGLVSGRNYMDCNKQTDPQMKCVCFVRQYTKYNSNDCGTREIAKDGVNYACKHNSNCKRGFVDDNNNCKGLNKVTDTDSCRKDCMASVYKYFIDNYESTFDNNSIGLTLNTIEYSRFMNEDNYLRNHNEPNIHECASWRKEQ